MSWYSNGEVLFIFWRADKKTWLGQPEDSLLTHLGSNLKTKWWKQSFLQKSLGPWAFPSGQFHRQVTLCYHFHCIFLLKLLPSCFFFLLFNLGLVLFIRSSNQIQKGQNKVNFTFSFAQSKSGGRCCCVHGAASWTAQGQSLAFLSCPPQLPALDFSSQCSGSGPRPACHGALPPKERQRKLERGMSLPVRERPGNQEQCFQWVPLAKAYASLTTCGRRLGESVS